MGGTLSLLLTSLACGHPEAALGVSEDALTYVSPPVDGGCTTNRRIGLRDPSTCHGSVGSWAKSPLFPPMSFSGPVPPELATYCLFEWTGSGPPSMIPAQTSADCAVIAPAGHPYDSTNAVALQDAFLAQVDLLSPLPNPPTSLPTKVMIVDSAVDQGFPDPGSGFLEHGELMGTIVRAIGCPSPGVGGAPCLTDVASVLALPLKKSGATYVDDEVNGGNLGTPGHLAAAIVDAIHGSHSAPGSRTIVSMSLGWDGRYGGAFVGNDWTSLPEPVRAVYSAIQYADCQLALVIAAAGNASGGQADQTPGAAFPGQWESKAAPSAARCNQLGGGPGAPSTTPMLYAFGGVDGLSQRLVNTRPGGLPSFLAPASHAAFAAPFLAPETGTSVAAAVGAGVAGVLWAYLPGLSAGGLMAELWGASIDTSEVPDFCRETLACPSVSRRVSLCEAVMDACGSGACTSTAACADPNRDGRPTGLDFSTPLPVGAPQTFVNNGYVPQCGARIFSKSSILPKDPCPSRQYFSRYGAPWLLAQPDSIGCPTCALLRQAENTSELRLGISLDVPYKLSAPAVRVQAPDGSERVFDLDIPSSHLVPGATIEVTDIPVSASLVAKASMEFVLDDHFVSSDEVLVEP